MPSDPAVRAYIGLGSNLNDPVSRLRAGRAALAALPASRLDACSSLYRTAPVGPIAQPDFVNAVCRIETRLAPAALMQALLAIEQAHGRVRDAAQPGGPRTLDLDLLLYGDAAIDSPALTVPHPRLHERAFVLYPLAEIAPALVLPGRGPVEQLLAHCAGQPIERLSAPF